MSLSQIRSPSLSRWARTYPGGGSSLKPAFGGGAVYCVTFWEGVYVFLRYRAGRFAYRACRPRYRHSSPATSRLRKVRLMPAVRPNGEFSVKDSA
jgi:hypothetical protein